MTQTLQVEKEVEVERAKLSPALRSKWSSRFIWAAILQGIGAVIATIPLLLSAPPVNFIKPSVASVIAGGSAGTWFTVGYFAYFMVGVLAVAVTALFYYHFEVNMNKPYKGLSNYLAWTHLVLMNVGVVIACGLLMYGGYFGAAAMASVSSGGLGWTSLQTHLNILSPLVNPIGYAIIITGIGVVAGGLGFVYNNFRSRGTASPRVISGI
jgi:hypothetical protein